MAEYAEKTFTMKDGNVFAIRSATPTDASQLVTYLKAMFREAPYIYFTAEEFEMTEEQEAQFLKDLEESQSGIMLLALFDGKIIGNIDGRARELRRIEHRVSFGMSVHPDFKGQGVGKTLLQCFLDFAKNNKVIEKVELGVIEENTAAYNLYYSQGFREEGRSLKGFYSDEGKYHDEIHMGLWVKLHRSIQEVL